MTYSASTQCCNGYNFPHLGVLSVCRLAFALISVTKLFLDELLKPANTTQIHKAELSQPLCTAVQIALFNRFSSLNLIPAAIVGHSSGEIAGAYAAGYISMEEAITIAYYRGYVTTKRTLNGSMAAIGMGAQEVSDFLCDGVVVACENSQSSTTISGHADKVAQVVEAIKQKQPDMFTRLLKVNMAYHSGISQSTLPSVHLLISCFRSHAFIEF